jgi:hypothetical protein
MNCFAGSSAAFCSGAVGSGGAIGCVASAASIRAPMVHARSTRARLLLPTIGGCRAAGKCATGGAIAEQAVVAE